LRGQDLLKTLPLKSGFEVMHGRVTAVTCTLILRGFRCFIPHRWPGQSAPKRHSIPILTLPFAIINNTPIKGIIIPKEVVTCKASRAKRPDHNAIILTTENLFIRII